MFDRIIFEQIQETWRFEQTRCDEPDKEPPDLEALRAVIETAFLASLKKEEGRSLEFSLALVTQEEIEAVNQAHPFGSTQVIMRLHQPLPLDVESITKIAGAFNKNTTALAVEPAQSEFASPYQIWGALFYGPTTNLFNEVSIGGPGFTTLRPDCLIVTTASTGSLALSRLGHLLGHFESGQFTRSVPSPFTSKAMGNYIIAAVQKNKGWDPKFFYWHVYVEALELVLAEASSQGHGGTIILIPTDKVGTAMGLFQPTYSFTGDFGIGYLMDQTVASLRNRSLIGDSSKRLLSQRLEALAQLASIDGALIITTEWQMMAFGAKLSAPRWAKNIAIGPDAFGGGGGVFERSRLGMRHNSTIDFIGACPAAIGFVISEDGPIRGFAKQDEETILCWPDCRVSMFV